TFGTGCGSRAQDLARTAFRAERNVGKLRDASSQLPFDQRSRQRVKMLAKVALRKRVESGTLNSHFVRLQAHRANCGEVVAETWKQFFKRHKATAEQRMHMPSVREAASMRWLHGKLVAFQHDYLRKKLSQ